jgi:DNA-binding SARP family transcriptional activator/tetratricopeptide (TPR) repeat protein
MGKTADGMLRLLGPPQLCFEGSPIVFPSIGFCLIALLTNAPNYTQLRTTLAAQIWDNQAAQSNLRQLLLRMRKAAPLLDSILAYDNKSVWLVNADSQIDTIALKTHLPVSTIIEFEGLLASFPTTQFLEGIRPPSEYLAEFAALESASLSQTYFGLLENGLERLGRFGTFPIGTLRKVERALLAIDPDREQSYQKLIKVYGAQGNPNEANRVLSTLKKRRNITGDNEVETHTRVSAAIASSNFISVKQHTAVETPSIPTIQLPRLAMLAPRIVEAGLNGSIVRGLVEDVANNLARHRSFVTLAAHSGFLSQHDGGIPADNSKLRADYTVSSFLRPNAAGWTDFCLRLVSCERGSIIWSGEYSLSPESLAATSRSLISRIAAQLAAGVESDALARLSRQTNSDAYLHYLQGQDALRTCDLRSVRRARKAYAASHKEDANYAESISGLSNTLRLEWLLLGGNDPKYLTEAHELADLAARKDPTSSTGYWRRALINILRHRFDEALQDFDLAQELHPNSGDIIIGHADALGHIGDANLGWALFEKALDLNPTPPDEYWWMGAGIAFSRADYAKVVELCERLESDESVLRLLASAHGQLGNRLEARHYGQRLKETYPGQTAEEMSSLQPHRNKQDLQPFIDGLRQAGLK